MTLSPRRLAWLSLVALGTGGAAPISLLLAGSTLVMLKQPKNMVEQMALMHSAASRYLRFVLLPSLITFSGIWGYSLGRLPWLSRRLFAGVVSGLVGSVGLDLVRLWGYQQRYMPGDLPRQFGRMIEGPQAGPMDVLTTGYAYHALNGIDFGLVYALVLGPVHWTWGVAWGLVVYALMMLTPPMLMTGSGPFVREKGPGPALVALAAHVVMGVAIGGVTQLLGHAEAQRAPRQPRGLVELLLSQGQAA